MNTSTLFLCALLVTGGLATVPVAPAPVAPLATSTAPTTAAPAASVSTIPAVCFTKSTKCCYNFSACGVNVRRVKVVKRCPFRKCAKVCKPVCRPVRVKEPRRHCSRKRVRVSRGKHCGKWNFGLGKVNVCNPKFTYRRICYTKHVFVTKKRCGDVCGQYCRRVPATCTRFQIIKTPKYCPTLACEQEVTTGTATKPAVVLGKPLPYEYTPIVRTPKH